MHFNPQIETMIQEALRLTNEGKFPKALALFDQVRRADAAYVDQNAQIQFAAGLGLSATGRVDLALAALRRASELSPRHVASKLELARLYRRTGSDPLAYKALTEALSIEPENPRAIAQMAEHMMDQGDYAAAERMLEPRITLIRAGADRDLSAVLLLARLAPMAGRSEEALGLLERVLGDPNLSPSVQYAAKAAMVRLLDDLGRPNDAIAQARETHGLMNLSFDADAYERRADELIGAWDDEALRALPRAAKVDGAPEIVFVIGFPRSGTTLVERIIGAHPDAIACGELPGLRRIAAHLDPSPAGPVHMVTDPGVVTPELVSEASRSYASMVGRVLQNLAPGMRPGFVTDKNPLNAHHLPIAAALFRGCKVIHVTRDPVDACLSHHLHLYGPEHAASGDLQKLGRVYRVFERLMQHWREHAEALGASVHHIAYEDLVHDAGSTSRSLVEFTGLDWDEACLRFPACRPAARTPCLDQVRRDIFETSIGRAGKYAAHTGPLRDALSN